MLRVRVLGRVPYEEAMALQRAVHRAGGDEYVLVLEHPHVFTLGRHGDPAHVLVDPAAVGATLAHTDRGGDVTYHGPGQVVLYPVVDVGHGIGAGAAHVRTLEDLVIGALRRVGLPTGRLSGFAGVWIDAAGTAPRKIAAVGVRVLAGRTLHGLALNVDPDLSWFDRIVPCGIADKSVTSMAAEGVGRSMGDVVDLLVEGAVARWAGGGAVDRQDAAWPPARRGGPAPLVGSGAAVHPAPRLDLAAPADPGQRARVRLAQAGVDSSGALPVDARKPPWLRLPARRGDPYLATGRAVRQLGLVTVCEEAGCPNITECWSEGTATFMINGERCTRSCGFCLVDTGRPAPPDPTEPDRVARAVEQLGLAHAVVTAVARDDLADGGAAGFAATIAAIRRRCPGTAVEVLVPDCKGEAHALDTILASAPDVFNHNLETVARLQRAVRPSAGYARSLAVLARAKAAGSTTKSGLMVGLGETPDELVGALADLRNVGVDIVTVGQYLRPSARHLPVARWWSPDEMDDLGDRARAMGFAHVEASPLTRSSYHARRAADTVAGSGPSAAVVGPGSPAHSALVPGPTR